MAYPARILAVALLTTVLAAPATLHASGLPDSRQATRGDISSSLRYIGGWSFDWLVRLLRQVLPKEGGGLDPSGNSSVRPSPTPSDGGGALDPSG
jgi:hypothetical protein